MKKKLVLLTVATLTMSQPAQAAYACEGRVSEVTLTPEGDIGANFGHGNMRICVSGASVGIYRDVANGSPATITAVHCEVLYSAFLSAMASGRRVIAYFNGTGPTSGVCTIATGSNGMPNPYPYAIYFLNN